TADADRSRSRDEGGVACTRSSSSRTMRRSRSRLGGLRSTGIEGRLARGGAAFERTTTLRVDFAVVAFAAARGRACFAVTAGRFAERRRPLWGRGDFFGF